MPVLSEAFVPRDRNQLARLKEQRNQTYRDLAVPGKLGTTTVYKVFTGRQLTISYPKAELIAKGLGARVEDLFRPEHVEGE